MNRERLTDQPGIAKRFYILIQKYRSFVYAIALFFYYHLILPSFPYRDKRSFLPEFASIAETRTLHDITKACRFCGTHH